MVGDIVNRKQWDFVQLIIKSNNELKMTTIEKCTRHFSKLSLLNHLARTKATHGTMRF